jgi:hypothetical protein
VDRESETVCSGRECGCEAVEDKARCAHTQGEEEDAGHSGHYRELLSTYRILCSYTSGIVGLS